MQDHSTEKQFNKPNQDIFWTAYFKPVYHALIPLFCILIVLSMGIIQCNFPTNAGGGTDLPNTFVATGHIIHKDGSPGIKTEVKFIPQDYVPNKDNAEVPMGITDSNGYYSVTLSITNTYNLQAHNQTSRTSLLCMGISFTEDTLLLENQTLHKPGTLEIILPDNFHDSVEFVYLSGTEYHAYVKPGAGRAVIDHVPAGVLPAIYLSSTDSDVSDLRLSNSAIVFSDQTTQILPESGIFHQTLFLNTTSNGADIDEDIYNFPLALRLADFNINLNEFTSDGHDLVITNQNSRPLPVAIEHWDRENGEALVWILVDTVYGNNSTQSLRMFWGNTDSMQNILTGNVFDTADGFTAVWHLSEGCDDATANNHSGVKMGHVTDTSGILGGAQRFHGNDDDYIRISSLLGELSTVTLSAWALLDTPDIIGSEVISIGDAALIRMDDSWNSKGTHGAYLFDPTAPDTVTHEFLGSGIFLQKTGWNFLAYQFDGQTLEHRFFINGQLCCSETASVPIQYAGAGENTTIGTHGNMKFSRNFTGIIDEVRVCSVIRSDSWIRLSYMNQQEENKLVYIYK